MDLTHDNYAGILLLAELVGGSGDSAKQPAAQGQFSL
jgi:hypothetical protein